MLQIWRTSWTPVKVAYLFCRYVCYSHAATLHSPSTPLGRRYWVLAVVPYLLYCFAVNHSLETCQRIFKVCLLDVSIFSILGLTTVTQIPVALAMWNQASAECILLIRTYAFFNRNRYILALLVSALAGVVAYQLFVATSEMDRECCVLPDP